MNATCSLADLRLAAATASRGVTGRSIQPVQNNVHLRAVERALTLTATDLERIQVSVTIPANVLDSGEATVPARIFAEITNTLTGDDTAHVRLSDKNAFVIGAARARYDLRTLPAEDHQTMPALVDPLVLELPRPALAAAFSDVVYAVSQDNTRPILAGASLALSGGMLKIITTDTYRLALCTMPIPMPVAEPRSVIVDADILRNVMRLGPGEEGETTRLALTDKQAEFTIGNVTIGTRLIEGQYPNVEKVIPDVTPDQVSVARGELLEAVRRARVIGKEDAQRVCFAVRPGSLGITAHGETKLDTASESIPCQFSGTEGFDVAFNGKFVEQALGAAACDEIRFDLDEKHSIAAIRIPHRDDFLSLLMPMHVM